MDNKEKIRILKEMRKLISIGVESCFCPAYAKVMNGIGANYGWVTEQMLNKIGLYKPEKMYSVEGNWWYARHDKQTRLQKIDEAITKFENEMKTNKFAVKVHNKYLSEAVQKLAFDNGYKWYSSGANAINTDQEIIYLNDAKLIECSTRNYFNIHHSSEYPLYSALTDWNKIEQAMKPKEPMVIWVNLYEGRESVGGNNVWLSYEQARAGMSDKTKTIKFQEVIE